MHSKQFQELQKEQVKPQDYVLSDLGAPKEW